jgi:uncharacterized protein
VDLFIHPGLKVTKSSIIDGYGVYTIKDLKAGTLIEECHHIKLTEQDGENSMFDVRFKYPRNGIFEYYTVPLGFGCIYNHMDKNNCDWRTNPKTSLFEFFTIKDITAGSELFTNYGELWWNVRSTKEKVTN